MTHKKGSFYWGGVKYDEFVLDRPRGAMLVKLNKEGGENPAPVISAAYGFVNPTLTDLAYSCFESGLFASSGSNPPRNIITQIVTISNRSFCANKDND